MDYHCSNLHFDFHLINSIFLFLVHLCNIYGDYETHIPLDLRLVATLFRFK